MKHTLLKALLAMGSGVCAVGLAGAALPGVYKPNTSADMWAANSAGAKSKVTLVSVPGGRLEMGGCTPVISTRGLDGNCGQFADVLTVELPKHGVQVSSFEMARTEVTLAQFKRFMTAAGRTDLATPEFRRANAFGDLAAVTHVSWQDAQDYVAWLNQTQGPGHRLPTEAEWEHACRAGADPTFCGGDAAAPVAWTLEAQLDGPAAVATKTPNAWGLHDMSGNVWEWTQDCWNTSYHGAPTDGSAWLSGDCTGRVLRGGSWLWPKDVARATMRANLTPDTRMPDAGFRVVRDVSRVFPENR